MLALPAGTRRALTRLRVNANFLTRGRRFSFVQVVIRGPQRTRPDPPRLRTDGGARGVIYVLSKEFVKCALRQMRHSMIYPTDFSSGKENIA